MKYFSEMDELTLTRLQENLDSLPDLPPVESDNFPKSVKWPIVAETIYRSLVSELDDGKFLKLLESPFNNTQV